ncbi:MAG: serine/threonine protein kinase [Candidatus Obscuribacterales bacterium]|nr:serine/threonine protein kinase [Candidatus Obscuribacterales bacterium]
MSPTAESQPSFPQLENVRIELLLGEGSSSTVYRGRQLNFDRPVAIKVLNIEKPQRFELEKFHLEARILAKLEHQNIARIWQFGLTIDTEQPYIVMELVEGQPLSALLKSGHSLRTQELRSIFLPLLQALNVVHNAGIVHRDLKPGNILLSTSETEPRVVPKLIDFGIAKVRKSSLETESTTTVTDERPILGSAAYMSPEQCSGQRISAQSDIYAIGCILFECVVGSRLHDGATVAETMLCKIKNASPSSKVLARKYKIPEALATCIARCLKKTPSDRFASALELEQALDDALTNDLVLPLELPQKAPVQFQWRLMLIAAAVIIPVSGLAVALSQRQHSTTVVPIVRRPSGSTGKGFLAAKSAADAVYRKDNNYREALPLYRQALSRYSERDSAGDVFDAFRSACECLEQMEQTANWDKEKEIHAEERLALLKKSLGENVRRRDFSTVNFGATLRTLCNFSHKHGRIREAEKFLKEFPLPADSPQARRQIQLAILETLLNDGKYHEGLKLAQDLVRSEKEQSSFDACITRAYVYAFKKRLNLPASEVARETMELLDTAEITKSERANIAGMMAEYCFMFNDFELCLELLQDSLISKTREDNGDMYFLLIRRARALALSGHRAEAEKLLARTQRQFSGLTLAGRRGFAAEISKLKQELATGRQSS